MSGYDLTSGLTEQGKMAANILEIKSLLMEQKTQSTKKSTSNLDEDLVKELARVTKLLVDAARYIDPMDIELVEDLADWLFAHKQKERDRKKKTKPSIIFFEDL